MKIEITFLTDESSEYFRGWRVDYDGKYADGLGYDEMLGLVAAITMPQERPTLQWLKTPEQHKQWRDSLETKN